MSTPNGIQRHWNRPEPASRTSLGRHVDQVEEIPTSAIPPNRVA